MASERKVTLHTSYKNCTAFFPSSYVSQAESQTNFEVRNEDDFSKLLAQEEESVRQMCEDIIALKPTLVITEKGVSGMVLCVFVSVTV